MHKLTLLVFVLLASGAPVCAQTLLDCRQSGEFCEDTPFPQPAPIPDNVITMLLQTDAGREGVELCTGLADDHRIDEKACLRTNLFRGTAVHLSGNDEADLIVIGVCPMCGADNGWFWLVRSPDKNPQLALWAGANCLQILHSRTHGLFDVQSTWSSGAGTRTRTYRFNGTEYKQSKQKWVEKPW